MTKENPMMHILRGLLSAGVYAITTILIPWLILDAVGGAIDTSGSIRFWIIAAGMVVIALAFARESSPSRSIRKVVFNTLLTLANMFYIYSYWFSGLANINLEIPVGSALIGFNLDLGTLLAIQLGVIGLKIIVLIYDLIDAIIYQVRRKTKIKVDPNADESDDSFAQYLEQDGGR